MRRFDREELRARTHPLVGPASLHCALVRGGAGLSTYAPECRLQIERRTLPGESPEQVIEELHTVVHSAGEEASISLMLDRPSHACSPDSAIARCVRDAAALVAGGIPAERGVGYWMDAALFAGAGIPTVDFGPDGAGAHEDEEWVDVDSLVTCARVLTECGRGFRRYAAPSSC